MKNIRKFIIFFISLLPISAFAATKHLEQIIADYMVWLVIIVVPFAVIYIFWKIHILPEIYAEKVHHPQTKLIQVICTCRLYLVAYSGP